MNIYILQPIAQCGIEWLKSQPDTHVTICVDPDCNEWIEKADAIIVRGRTITKKEIASSKKLKVIAKHGIGTDAIDITAAKAKKIVVTNTPSETVESVAEQAVALMLAVSRNVCFSHNSLKHGDVLSATAPMENTYMGIELYGKSVGIIGTGRIAIATGAILSKGFHMDIKVFAPEIRPQRWYAAGYPVMIFDNLISMVEQCDFISCHLPDKPCNYNLLNRQVLEHCKKNAIIVNTGRGNTIDEEALYWALENKVIRGAGADVFREEPVSPLNPLLSLQNFVASPHNGTNTFEALERASMSVCKNAYEALCGKIVENVVV